MRRTSQSQISCVSDLDGKNLQVQVTLKVCERRPVLLTALLLLLFGPAPQARAQLCPGSHIYLVVRDENGRVLDPTPLSARRSLARTFDFVNVKKIDVPAGYKAAARTAKALVFSDDGCTFRPLEEATFERRGRKMRLVFRNAARVRDRSVFYTIDLPPFSQGTFEIDLSAPAGRLPKPSGTTPFERAWSTTFSARAWRRTSESAPDLPGPHSVSLRGTVTNAVTRLPMAGAEVELLLGQLGEELYPARVETDPLGHFEIAGVPDEKLIASDRVSVRARAKDFAAAQVVILNHRQLAQTREAFDNLSMELRPLVTIKGRLVNVETGRPATITPGTLKAFALADETLIGGDYMKRVHTTAEAEIEAGGSFTMVVPAGKISFSIMDYQQYQTVQPGTRQELLDGRMEVNVEAENQPEVVFRVRRANP